MPLARRKEDQGAAGQHQNPARRLGDGRCHDRHRVDGDELAGAVGLHQRADQDRGNLAGSQRKGGGNRRVAAFQQLRKPLTNCPN